MDTVGAALGQEIGVKDSFQRCSHEAIHGKPDCLKSGSGISLSKYISTCPQPGARAQVISEGWQQFKKLPSVLSRRFSADFQGTCCDFSNKTGWPKGWDEKDTPPRCL